MSTVNFVAFSYYLLARQLGLEECLGVGVGIPKLCNSNSREWGAREVLGGREGTVFSPGSASTSVNAFDKLNNAFVGDVLINCSVIAVGFDGCQIIVGSERVRDVMCGSCTAAFSCLTSSKDEIFG